MEKWPISVLFVDDEKILRTVYERIIGNWVTKIYMAENGLDGLEMYEKHLPDLVITDIKMPIMSGLDMTLKIKGKNPSARVIILSAFSESNYLIRAIEIGIQNFLLKPVDNQSLYKAIAEQAQQIKLAHKLVEEEAKRIKAENELKHNEQILHAVSETAANMLNFGFNSGTINFSLKNLGQATKVSRVYLFENFVEDGLAYSRQTHEWVADAIVPQLDNTMLMAVPHEDPSFKRWAGILRNHQSIHGLVKDFPEEERAVLEPQDIVSVIAIPVFVNGEWYGFLGFDDCKTERSWSLAEINTLVTAANIFGAAIHRSGIEHELQALNADLEERVHQRTQSLQDEILERKTAELMLRQSEEKYRSIFENANDAIFLSINEQIKLINPRFYELTGYYPNQIMGKSFLDMVHPAYRKLVYENYMKRLKQQEVAHSYDIQIITSKGISKWVEIKTSSISWEGSDGFLSFLTDIQERKTYENELRALNSNLEARVQEELKQREKQQELFLHKSKLESLGELSAGMAHEINQPLGGLSMSLENIQDEIDTAHLNEAYLREKIALMFEDIERIRSIIEHVRIFSREQQSEEQRPFDLIQTINNALMLMNKLFISNQIDLIVSISNNGAVVLGNPYRLEQVLMNILSNARYAVDMRQQTSDSSTYTKSITLFSYHQDHHHIIELTDNGTGIPDEIIGSVFNPFFTTKNAVDGTGLGLSVSYGIIRDMKGSIEIESKLNQFTKVTIKLPEYKQP